MIIEQNAHGYIIRRKRKDHNKIWYYCGMKDQKPVFKCDHLYARAFKRIETAQRTLNSLKAPQAI